MSGDFESEIKPDYDDSSSSDDDDGSSPKTDFERLSIDYNEKYKAYEQECKKYRVAPIRSLREVLANDQDNFNLSYYMPQSIGIQLACKAVLNQPWVNIKKIDFTCSPFDLNTCELLAELIQAAAELETLNLSGCGIELDGLQALSPNLEISQSVRLLNLSRCKLNDAAGAHVAKMFKNNNIIQHLDLSHNKLSNHTGTEFGKILRINTTLLTLNLAWNEMHKQETCIIPFLKGLAKNTALLEINLAWNNLEGEEFAKTLKTLLTKSKSLESIDLQYNKITSKELRIFQAAFKKSTVKRFYLDENPLTEEETMKFLTVLQNGNELTVLSIGKDKVFSESCFAQIDEFKTKFETLQLIYGGVFESKPLVPGNYAGILMDRCRFLATTQQYPRDMCKFFKGILANNEGIEIFERGKFVKELHDSGVQLDDKLLDQMVNYYAVDKDGTPIKKEKAKAKPDIKKNKTGKTKGDNKKDNAHKHQTFDLKRMATFYLNWQGLSECPWEIDANFKICPMNTRTADAV